MFPDEKALIIKLFQEYASAFARFDLERTRACYSLPALLVSPNHVVAMPDASVFDIEFQAMFSMLKEQGFARAKSENSSLHFFSREAALVSSQWSLFCDNGDLITHFSATYQTTKSASGWRIQSTIAHDEATYLSLSENLDFRFS